MAKEYDGYFLRKFLGKALQVVGLVLAGSIGASVALGVFFFLLGARGRIDFADPDVVKGYILAIVLFCVGVLSWLAGWLVKPGD